MALKPMPEDLRVKVNTGFAKMEEEKFPAPFKWENVTIAPTLAEGSSAWAEMLKNKHIESHDVLWAFIEYPGKAWWLACKLSARVMKAVGEGDKPRVFDLCTSYGREFLTEVEQKFQLLKENELDEDEFAKAGFCDSCGSVMYLTPVGTMECPDCD